MGFHGILMGFEGIWGFHGILVGFEGIGWDLSIKDGSNMGIRP